MGLPAGTFAGTVAAGTRLVAFAVLFNTAGLATGTTPLALAELLLDNFGESGVGGGMGEAVVAVEAVAVLGAGQPGSKAVAVLLDALGAAAIAPPFLFSLVSVDHLFKFKAEVANTTHNYWLATTRSKVNRHYGIMLRALR